MEQTRTSWMGRVRTLLRQVLAGAISQVKRRFKQLKSRYGPRYTKVMVGAAFVSLFSPIPGSVLIAVALIVAIAEIHRAISRRGSLRKTRAKEFVFSNRPGNWNSPLSDEVSSPPVVHSA